jgi:hypothetical protein
MSIHYWLQHLRSALTPRQGQRHHQQRRSPRPNLEVLEDRLTPSFSPALAYAAGGGPRDVMTADFNNDGRLDLVTANGAYGANSVSLLLGNGDGTFQPARNTPTSEYPISLAVGDFNEDGRLDVATANDYVPGNEGVSVLLGQGDGTFAGADSPSPFEWSAAIVTGDLNADGHMDLVATVLDYYGDTSICAMLGHGDGTFTTTTYGWYSPYLIATSLAKPALADVNGDGNLDVAVPGAVFLGNGDGTLQEPISFDTGADLWFARADFNADGNLDRADLNTDANLDPAGYGPVGLSVSLGNGDGTFAPPIWTAAGDWSNALAVGDFNADGRPDAAVANGTNSVAVLLNDGTWDGTPPAPRASSFLVSGFSSSVTAGTAGAFSVTVLDDGGSVMNGYTGTVYFTSSDAQAGLPDVYTFTAADQGIHTFSATLKTAGTQSLTVADGAATGTQTNITVNPAAATSFTVAGFPSSVTAGVVGSFTVTARDPYGNRATGYTGTVHFTSSDARATLPGNYAFTAADAGVRSFNATLKTAGKQSLTAKDISNAAIAGAQGNILVNPAAASRLVLSAPTAVSANTSFSLTVTVVDAYGNVVTGYRGTLSFSSSDVTANLPKKYTFTAADQGVHTFTGLRLKKKGQPTIWVTDTLNKSLTGSVVVAVL